MIGSGLSNIAKTQKEEWTDKGFCFQYDFVRTFPDTGTSDTLFLFNPAGIGADIILHVFPLEFVNPEDGPIIINYYAGGDYAGGTPLTLLNKNGNSSNTANVVVTEAPTGTTKGLLTSSNKVAKGGALPSQSGGGQPSENRPFIASASVPFLIEIVNSSGAAVATGVYFEFCEVPKQFN